MAKAGSTVARWSWMAKGASASDCRFMSRSNSAGDRVPSTGRSFEGDLAGRRRIAALGELDHHGEPGNRHLHAQRREGAVVAEEKIEAARLGIGIGPAVVALEAGDRMEQQGEVQHRHALA